MGFGPWRFKSSHPHWSSSAASHSPHPFPPAESPPGRGSLRACSRPMGFWWDFSGGVRTWSRRRLVLNAASLVFALVGPPLRDAISRRRAGRSRTRTRGSLPGRAALSRRLRLQGLRLAASLRPARAARPARARGSASGAASVSGAALPGRVDDAIRVAVVRRYPGCPAGVGTLCLSPLHARPRGHGRADAVRVGRCRDGRSSGRDPRRTRDRRVRRPGRRGGARRAAPARVAAEAPPVPRRPLARRPCDLRATPGRRRSSSSSPG